MDKFGAAASRLIFCWYQTVFQIGETWNLKQAHTTVTSRLATHDEREACTVVSTQNRPSMLVGTLRRRERTPSSVLVLENKCNCTYTFKIQGVNLELKLPGNHLAL